MWRNIEYVYFIFVNFILLKAAVWGGLLYCERQGIRIIIKLAVPGVTYIVHPTLPFFSPPTPGFGESYHALVLPTICLSFTLSRVPFCPLLPSLRYAVSSHPLACACSLHSGIHFLPHNEPEAATYLSQFYREIPVTCFTHNSPSFPAEVGILESSSLKESSWSQLAWWAQSRVDKQLPSLQPLSLPHYFYLNVIRETTPK